MKTLTFNGKQVKSITRTEKAQQHHNTTLIINGHVIQGISKSDCLDLFESDRFRFDDCLKNQTEWFNILED